MVKVIDGIIVPENKADVELVMKTIKERLGVPNVTLTHQGEGVFLWEVPHGLRSTVRLRDLPDTNTSPRNHKP